MQKKQHCVEISQETTAHLEMVASLFIMVNKFMKMLIKRKLTKKDLMKSLKNKQDYKRLGKNIEKALKIN